MTVTLVVFASGVVAFAEDEFEAAPILYSQSRPENAITRLQEQVDRREVELARDGTLGYLPSLLSALKIPVESQSLVFSKTSLQIRRISPRTPRAIYFNDDVYVGYCQDGDVLEISTADAKLGTVFYTLEQSRAEGLPTFERQTESCLTCHGTSRTENVPGHLLRSLYVEKSGQPIFSAGSRNVTHATPFEERWGGWYVTGEHGAQRHLGNRLFERDERPDPEGDSSGLNVTSLAGKFEAAEYLAPHSDIVALMVLEHQVFVHNRITSANFATRQALDYNAMMNRALENPEETRLDSTTRRIASAAEKLVEALLLVDEPPLTAEVKGTSGYADRFAAQGRRDQKGRSLRDLDLKTRLFRYPCSYLIRSESFQKLPDEVRAVVWERLREVLSGEDPSKKFAHLSAEDRAAIREIISETVEGVPVNWAAEKPL
jgi:hypothetical protein